MVMQHYTTVHQIQSPRTTKLGPNWPQDSGISALHTDLSDYTRYKMPIAYFEIYIYFFYMSNFFSSKLPFFPDVVKHAVYPTSMKRDRVRFQVDRSMYFNFWRDHSDFTDRKLWSSGVKDRRSNAQRSINRRVAYTTRRKYEVKIKLIIINLKPWSDFLSWCH